MTPYPERQGDLYLAKIRTPRADGATITIPREYMREMCLSIGDGVKITLKVIDSGFCWRGLSTIRKIDGSMCGCRLPAFPKGHSGYYAYVKAEHTDVEEWFAEQDGKPIWVTS